MEIAPRHDKQIEALRMEWKRYPPLMAAIRELKDVLKHPDDYLIEVGHKEARELHSEVDSRHPLASLAAYIELPVTAKTPFGTANFGEDKNFIQVHFSLNRTISEPNEGDFGTNLIFLSGDGQSLSGRLEIRVTNEKISPLDPSLTADQSIWFKALKEFMSENHWKLKGLKATLWTGLSGELQKK